MNNNHEVTEQVENTTPIAKATSVSETVTPMKTEAEKRAALEFMAALTGIAVPEKAVRKPSVTAKFRFGKAELLLLGEQAIDKAMRGEITLALATQDQIDNIDLECYTESILRYFNVTSTTMKRDICNGTTTFTMIKRPKMNIVKTGEFAEGDYLAQSDFLNEQALTISAGIKILAANNDLYIYIQGARIATAIRLQERN